MSHEVPSTDRIPVCEMAVVSKMTTWKVNLTSVSMGRSVDLRVVRMTYHVTAAGVKAEQGTDVEYSCLVRDCEACPQNLHRAWWGKGGRRFSWD